MVGTPTITSLEMDAGWIGIAWAEAEDSLDALMIYVQGADAGLVRWVASVRTVEVIQPGRRLDPEMARAKGRENTGKQPPS